MAEALRLAEFLAALSLATDLGMGNLSCRRCAPVWLLWHSASGWTFGPDDLIGQYRVRRCSGQARNRAWMAAQVRGSCGTVGPKGL